MPDPTWAELYGHTVNPPPPVPGLDLYAEWLAERADDLAELHEQEAPLGPDAWDAE